MGITGPAHFGFERQWLSKAIKNIPSNPNLFEKNNIEMAQYLLGLGNRQVLAIEYWLRCSDLIEKCENITRLTRLGEIIRLHDPYFEEIETWLCLHHKLCLNQNNASTYWFAFRKMPIEFKRRDLIESMKLEFPGKSERTYNDAVSVFYSIVNKTEINSLCRLVTIDDDEINQSINPKCMNSGIFSYVMCDWAQLYNKETANISELIEDIGPSKPFNLTKDTINCLLDQIQDRYLKKVLWVSRTAGLNSITFSGNIDPLALIIAYYLQHLEGIDPIVALRRGIEENDKLKDERK